MDITLFLYLNDALILIESCMQARIDGQRVSSLLQRLGFVLSLEKYQFRPTQVFTQVGVPFDTREMTISLPVDMVQVVNLKLAG